jgi:hypothetical protein
MTPLGWALLACVVFWVVVVVLVVELVHALT